MTWLYSPATASEMVSPADIGGKGAGLYWLRDQGFPIPPTWVLSTRAFDAMVEAADIAAGIAALDHATAGQPDWMTTTQALLALADVQRDIEARLLAAPLPPDLATALQQLPPDEPGWAVRSSATVEDQRGHSFAGQFRSLLFVPPGPPLWEAIRAVWAMAFAENVLHCRAEHNAAMPRMAVVLQPMQPVGPSDRSGVVFSESTLPGLPHGTLIQATFGLGVTVVDGAGGELALVDGMYVRRRAPLLTEIAVTVPGGGITTAPAPPGPVLRDLQALRLARQVREIAHRWGGAVDVEFLWPLGQDPVFLQVRPLAELRDCATLVA